MILSFLLPGVGQYYLTKRWKRGLAFLLVSWIIGGVSFGLLYIIPWAYGLYDTYKISKAKEGAGPYKSIVFGQIG